MASYNLRIKKSAEKELRRLDRADLARLVEKIEPLANHPRPQGCEFLKGEDRYFRIRCGDYRVVYELDEASRTVTVIKIGHRREVYR